MCNEVNLDFFSGFYVYRVPTSTKSAKPMLYVLPLLLVLDQPSVLDFVDHERPLTTIHLNTLARFSVDRPGKYAMTALKKMTGTDAFMSMSNSEKECQLETFEECNKERVLAAFESECNCYPWLLANSETVSANMKKF